MITQVHDCLDLLFNDSLLTCLSASSMLIVLVNAILANKFSSNYFAYLIIQLVVVVPPAFLINPIVKASYW